MKILFFIESLRAGGKERRIVELLKGLKAYPDIEVGLVLTRDEIHYEEIYKMEIPLFFIKRKYLKKDPLLFLKFHKIVKHFSPDLIHVWGVMVAVYAVPSVAILKIPMVNNMITDTSPQHRWRNKFAFKYSSRIIANSHVGIASYEAPKLKSNVIYNGFDFTRLTSIKKEESIKLEFGIKTKYVVGMVATFSIRKDYATYVSAAIEVLAENKDITFICVGDGDDGKIKSMVPDVLKNHILFLGRQSNVETIINSCDIGILTSNIEYHGEGISNALMEFMASQKPVIATNHGGSVELIKDGESGFLVEAFNPSAIKDKVIYLIENPEARSRMGYLAQERIEKEFNIKTMVDSFYNEYRKVVC